MKKKLFFAVLIFLLICSRSNASTNDRFIYVGVNSKGDNVYLDNYSISRQEDNFVVCSLICIIGPLFREYLRGFVQYGPNEAKQALEKAFQAQLDYVINVDDKIFGITRVIFQDSKGMNIYIENKKDIVWFPITKGSIFDAVMFWINRFFDPENYKTVEEMIDEIKNGKRVNTNDNTTNNNNKNNTGIAVVITIASLLFGFIASVFAYKLLTKDSVNSDISRESNNQEEQNNEEQQKEQQSAEYEKLKDFISWLMKQPDYVEFNHWFDLKLSLQGKTSQDITRQFWEHIKNGGRFADIQKIIMENYDNFRNGNF